MNNGYQNINIPLNERGIGLVEVMVALLLLAVAGLGYSALQAQSLQATDESLTRTQAITILRSAAEKIRTNAINTTNNLKLMGVSTNTPQEVLEHYKNGLTYTPPPLSLPKAHVCNTDTGCSPLQIADNDIRQIKQSADSIGIKIGVDICPGTDGASSNQTLCLIAAWNDTTPTKGTGSNDCIDNEGGYNFNSDCVYMETY